MPNKIRDLTNQRFGKLVVVNFTTTRISGTEGKTNAWWRCKCDCGRFIEKCGHDLQKGRLKSCGICEPSGFYFDQDLTGKRFGKLLVIKRKEEYLPSGRWKTNRHWLCKCDCGNECIIFSHQLLTKGTKSTRSSCGGCNKQKPLEPYLIRHKKIIFDYLLKHPCVDCGETDIAVLDFDHVRGKTYNISNCPISKLLDEFTKCDIRCANCHRRRHYKEGFSSQRDWLNEL